MSDLYALFRGYFANPRLWRFLLVDCDVMENLFPICQLTSSTELLVKDCPQTVLDVVFEPKVISGKKKPCKSRKTIFSRGLCVCLFLDRCNFSRLDNADLLL